MIRADSWPTKFQTEFTNGEHSAASIRRRMAAEKHAVPLSSISVTVSLKRSNPDGPLFEYIVEFDGSLSGSQKGQLLSALEHCPVHKTLSNPLHFRLRATLND